MKIARILMLAVLAVISTALAVSPVHATEILITGTSIPNWKGPTTGMYLEIYADREFTDPTTGITIQPGTPDSGTWYKRYALTVSNTTDPDTGEIITSLVIPIIKLHATTNTTVGTKEARYSFYFVDSNGNRYPYRGFENVRVPPSFGTVVPTTGTWQILRSFNTGPVRPQYDLTYFSREETLRLLSTAIATSGGLFSLNSLSGSNQSFVNHTNITITSAGTTHTIGVTGSFAVGIGGTGATTAAGARTNLGAAASGPNSDITSLSALSTPLSGAQGGTGQSSYTIGDLLYASSSSGLSKLAAVATGQVLVSGGVATAPAWSASPTLTSITSTNLTVTGLTTGRIPYVGAADQILDDSAFLWDATNNRISIGTTLAERAVQIPNADYYAASNAAGSATLRLIGLDASNEISIGPSGTRVNFVGEVFSHFTPTVDYVGGQEEFDYLAPASIPPFSFAHGVAADFTTNSPGNNWALVGAATAAGTRPTVGVVGLANASGTAATQTFGGNFIAGVPTSGVAAATAQGVEINVVNIGNNPNVGLTGMSIQNVGGTAYGTVLGTFGAYLQLGVSNGGSIDHRASGRNGIVLDASLVDPLLTGAEASGLGITSALISVNGTTTPTYGINLAGLNATSDSALLMANGDGVRSNTTGLVNVNLVSLSTGNYLEVGDGNYNASGMLGMVFRPGSAETVRITRGGSSSEIGNIGLNMASPTYQVHQRTSTKRTLTGTHAVVNGSTRVLGTATAYDTELAPGSSFTIDGTTVYTVRRVVNATTIYLTTTYGGSTTAGNTAYSDYAAVLIENRETVSGSGDDWAMVGPLPRLVVRGDSLFGDARGTFAIQSREQPNQVVTTGIHATALTGTVTMTNGSAAVVGAGTLFWGADGIASADDEVTAGAYVYIAGQTKLYQVSAVTAANALTLTELYASATTAGLTMWEGGYSYISSLEVNTGWRPLILQGGASSSDVGGVLIGTTGISTTGAMLKVEGGGAKTTNHVGSEFNNIATSTSSFQKIGALYIAAGAWTGPSIANYAIAVGAVEGTGGNRSNIPYAGLGGKSIFAPHSTQVVTPSPYTTLLPTATVDVYGYATEVVSIGADTVQTTAPGLMTGTGTTWNTVGATDRLRPGDAVMFSSDTEVYEVDSLTSDTVMNTTGVYNGTPSGSVEAYRDPYLFRLRNSFGTERFRVESSGFTKVNGTLVQKTGTTLASAASLVLGSGNVFFVTGNVTVTNIYTYSGLGADTSESGRIITLVWGSAVGDTFDVTDGGNLKLAGNVTTFDSDDTLTLYFDGTNFYEIARSAN